MKKVENQSPKILHGKNQEEDLFNQGGKIPQRSGIPDLRGQIPEKNLAISSEFREKLM